MRDYLIDSECFISLARNIYFYINTQGRFPKWECALSSPTTFAEGFFLLAVSKQTENESFSVGVSNFWGTV